MPEAKTRKLFARVDADVDHWIEQQAEIEERSKQSIILRALRAQMQAQQQQDAR